MDSSKPSGSEPRAVQLSVVVLTKNEEQRIVRCLESVTWVDEIVVIDGMSTDRTVELCQRYGARVIQHPFGGSFAEERNLGLEQARGEWVLQIDADDVVTPEFHRAVKKLLERPPVHDAYKFRRKSYLLGRWMRYGGWHHYLPNLVRRQTVRYVGTVHERPLVEGTIGVLEADIEHHPCETFSEFISRHNRYTSLQAEEWSQTVQAQASSPRQLMRNMIRRPWKTFWKSYVKKQGFREGLHGLSFACFFAWIECIKWAKCWELHQRVTQPDMMSITKRIDAENVSSSLQANSLFAKAQQIPIRMLIYQIVWGPCKVYWNSYVRQKGYQTGTVGIVLSLLSSVGYALVWLKYWELMVKAQAGSSEQAPDAVSPVQHVVEA